MKLILVFKKMEFFVNKQIYIKFYFKGKSCVIIFFKKHLTFRNESIIFQRY